MVEYINWLIAAVSGCLGFSLPGWGVSSWKAGWEKIKKDNPSEVIGEKFTNTLWPQLGIVVLTIFFLCLEPPEQLSVQAWTWGVILGAGIQAYKTHSP